MGAPQAKQKHGGIGLIGVPVGPVQSFPGAGGTWDDGCSAASGAWPQMEQAVSWGRLSELQNSQTQSSNLIVPSRWWQPSGLDRSSGPMWPARWGPAFIGRRWAGKGLTAGGGGRMRRLVETHEGGPVGPPLGRHVHWSVARGPGSSGNRARRWSNRVSADTTSQLLLIPVANVITSGPASAALICRRPASA